MRRLTGFRPSPAMVVACLALLLALGGTGYAATQLLPRNSVTTVQVKDFSLLARDFKRGQIPPGPAGPAGAPGAAGPAGPAGPTGSAKAYAHVLANGTVDVAHSQGISDSSITHTSGTGIYCIHVEGAKIATATIETEAGFIALIIPPTTCAAGREIELRTYGASGGAAEKAFFIVVS